MDIDIAKIALCQPHTEVGKDEAGIIVIQQTEPHSTEYQVIEIQPYFLPLFISWLQELVVSGTVVR